MLALSSELQRLCRLDGNSDPARRWNEHAAGENEGDRDGVRDLQKEKKKKTDRQTGVRSSDWHVHAASVSLTRTRTQRCTVHLLPSLSAHHR